MTQRMINAAGWLAASCVLVVMTAAPALAQSQVRVNVPFTFEAGGKVLPSGQYLIERSPLAGTSVLKIHSLDQNESIAVATMAVANPGTTYDPHLKFEMRASGYRLSEVWMPGAEVGALLPKAKNPALLAKQEGKSKPVVLSLTPVR